MAAAGDTGSEKREKQSPKKGRPSEGDDDELILRELVSERQSRQRRTEGADFQLKHNCVHV